MQKGFDFWISPEVSSFLRKYWIMYSISYLLAAWLTIEMNNPFVFLIIGFMPYPIIRIYKAIHDPFYNLEESIKKIDLVFYKLLLQHEAKVLKVEIATIKHKHREAHLYLALLTSPEHNMHPSIFTFIKNNKKINNGGMASLYIWFLTFLVFLFVLFLSQ